MIHFTVRITDSAGGVLGTGGGFGDDAPSYGHGDVDCAPPGSPTPTAAASSAAKTVEEDHAYRRAGTYTADFQAVSDGCGRGERIVVVHATLTITPGPLLSNGPLPVRAAACANSGSGPCAPSAAEPTGGDVHLDYQGEDNDGYVHVISIDWGDHTPETANTYPLAGCQDPGRSWPRSLQTGATAHHYTQPGKHTVTVTVTSTGCDGRDPQTATTQLNLSSL